MMSVHARTGRFTSPHPTMALHQQEPSALLISGPIEAALRQLGDVAAQMRAYVPNSDAPAAIEKAIAAHGSA